MNNEPSFSRQIGKFLAKIQTKFDDWFEFGFKKLKETGKKEKKDLPPDAPLKDKAVHAAQTSAEFLGEVGETYYKTYQKLKAKKEEGKKP